MQHRVFAAALAVAIVAGCASQSTPEPVRVASAAPQEVASASAPQQQCHLATKPGSNLLVTRCDAPATVDQRDQTLEGVRRMTGNVGGSDKQR